MCSIMLPFCSACVRRRCSLCLSDLLVEILAALSSVDDHRLADPAVKCLVIIKDGTVVVCSSPGVETACIVDGEDIDLPDDWTNLSHRVVHSMPITINHDDMPYESPRESPETELAGTNVQVQHATAQIMNAPYCPDCDTNHSWAERCPNLDDAPEPT